MPDTTPPEDASTPEDASPSGEAIPQPEHAEETKLLAEMRALRRRARTARHAYWFPLLLFGVLTCTSAPFYIQPQPGGQSTGPVLPMFAGSPLVSSSVAWYWLAALLAGLLATQLWYRWHARRAGVQTASLRFIIVTLALTAAAALIPPLSQVRGPRGLRFLGHLHVLYPGDLVIRGTFAFVLIAAGLLVLAWAERSRGLAAIAVVYAGSAVLSSLYDVSNLTARLGWTPSPADEALPNILLPALILIAGAGAALAAQRRTPSPAARVQTAG
jgi:hypothetical protein